MFVQQVRERGRNHRAWKHPCQGFPHGKCATVSGRPLDGRTWARASPQHGTATREDQVRKVVSIDERWGIVLPWSPRHPRHRLGIPGGHDVIYQRTTERHQTPYDKKRRTFRWSAQFRGGPPGSRRRVVTGLPWSHYVWRSEDRHWSVGRVRA